MRWARQDSNLRPNGYASHYSFRCPFRVCGLDCPFIQIVLDLELAIQSLHLPMKTIKVIHWLGSGLPFQKEKASPNLASFTWELLPRQPYTGHHIDFST